MYDIENNVPIPRLKQPAAKYPFRDLQVGQSFFVPDVAAREKSMRAQVYTAAKHLGVKFTTRVENGGVRVWRIA